MRYYSVTMEQVSSIDEKEVALLYDDLDKEFQLVPAISKPEFDIDESEWPEIKGNKIPPRAYYLQVALKTLLNIDDLKVLTGKMRVALITNGGDRWAKSPSQRITIYTLRENIIIVKVMNVSSNVTKLKILNILKTLNAAKLIQMTYVSAPRGDYPSKTLAVREVNIYEAITMSDYALTQATKDWNLPKKTIFQLTGRLYRISETYISQKRIGMDSSSDEAEETEDTNQPSPARAIHDISETEDEVDEAPPKKRRIWTKSTDKNWAKITNINKRKKDKITTRVSSTAKTSHTRNEREHRALSPITEITSTSSGRAQQETAIGRENKSTQTSGSIKEKLQSLLQQHRRLEILDTLFDILCVTEYNQSLILTVGLKM